MRGMKEKELRYNYAKFKKQVKHLMEVAHKMVESWGRNKDSRWDQPEHRRDKKKGYIPQDNTAKVMVKVGPEEKYCGDKMQYMV